MRGLWGDAQLSSALVAFQVMIRLGWPRRWACAKLCWSVSHARLPVPGSHDGAQLPCGSSRKLPAKSMEGWWHSPCLLMNMHDPAAKTVFYQVLRPHKNTQRCFLPSHTRVRQDLSN